jgi:hypothetical protein
VAASAEPLEQAVAPLEESAKPGAPARNGGRAGLRRVPARPERRDDAFAMSPGAWSAWAAWATVDRRDCHRSDVHSDTACRITSHRVLACLGGPGQRTDMDDWQKPTNPSQTKSIVMTQKRIDPRLRSGLPPAASTHTRGRIANRRAPRHQCQPSPPADRADRSGIPHTRLPTVLHRAPRHHGCSVKPWGQYATRPGSRGHRIYSTAGLGTLGAWPPLRREVFRGSDSASAAAASTRSDGSCMPRST